MKIEKGIPIPKARRKGKYVDTIRAMAPGDSVYVATRKLAEEFRGIMGRLGFRAVVRREGTGARVWMKEKKEVKP